MPGKGGSRIHIPHPEGHALSRRPLRHTAGSARVTIFGAWPAACEVDTAPLSALAI